MMILEFVGFLAMALIIYGGIRGIKSWKDAKPSKTYITKYGTLLFYLFTGAFPGLFILLQVFVAYCNI